VETKLQVGNRSKKCSNVFYHGELCVLIQPSLWPYYLMNCVVYCAGLVLNKGVVVDVQIFSKNRNNFL
jgi:hypothetical protein